MKKSNVTTINTKYHIHCFQIALDGQVYNVGGVLTDIPRAYLNKTALATNIKDDPSAFHMFAYKTSVPQAPFKYTPRRGAPTTIVWPPKGVHIDVLFKAPPDAPQAHQSVQVNVSYEMYDGIPLLLKVNF